MRHLKTAAKLYLSRQFFLFLLCGAVSALANWASRFAFGLFFAFDASIALAYLVGMVMAYVLFKAFVFSSARPRQSRSLALFCLVNGIGFVQTLTVANLLRHLLLAQGLDQGFAQGAAHAAGVGSLAFTSFLLHRAFTFSHAPPTAASLARDPR